MCEGAARKRRPLTTLFLMASPRPLTALPPVVALVVAAGCIHVDDEPAAGPAARPKIAPITLAARGATDAPYVVDDQLHDGRRARPIALGGAVNANMIGTLAPVAVADPSGAGLAYNSWRGRRPLLRLRRNRTGTDSVLDEGAHSVAWARAGALAYFKAESPDLRHPQRYLGHVVVRRAPDAAAVPWTPRAGRYVVAAWAGRSVIAYRLGRSFPDLLVLDGPGRQRVLARGSALVAVSPGGLQAFVSRYGASPPLVRILDVASGTEVARLRVERRAAPYVVESGSWVGDRVLAATTVGIAVFGVSGRAIALEGVLRTEHVLPAGVVETRAVGNGGRVVAWGELASQPREAIPRAALVDCDVATFRCVRAAVTSSASPPRPIYNPSRP